MYVKITEQNLIKQLKEKNPQAIDYIIDQYGGLIKTVLLKNLYDQKDHWEECLNDCLLAVWNNPERFDGESLKLFYVRLQNTKRSICFEGN